jgi:hypothetical protein
MFRLPSLPFPNNADQAAPNSPPELPQSKMYSFRQPHLEEETHLHPKSGAAERSVGFAATDPP